MADTHHETLESREAVVAAWLAPGLDIEIVFPTASNTSYTAVLSEFDLSGVGATEDEALDALMSQVKALMTTYLLNGDPLPRRGKPPSAHAGRRSDTGDG